MENNIKQYIRDVHFSKKKFNIHIIVCKLIKLKFIIKINKTEAGLKIVK